MCARGSEDTSDNGWGGTTTSLLLALMCTAPTAVGHIEALSSPSVSAIISRFPPLGLPPFLQLYLHHQPGACSCTAARGVERAG